MTTADQYAVFGHPVSHSKSPRIHRFFAEQTGQILEYGKQDVPAEQFVETTRLFFQQSGKGLNCTVPLKELAWQFADQLTERARFAKAVNTLKLLDSGQILGDNTDGVGLVTDLTHNAGVTLTGKRLLILGAGGATRGIIAPLFQKQPVQITIANRTLAKAEALVEEFAELGQLTSSSYPQLAGLEFDLILNATSASLSAELPPLPDNILAEQGICYDLAYGNLPTPFVNWGKANHAAKSLDGLGMLVEQAAEAFYLWRGIRPPTAELIRQFDKERA